MELRLLAPVAAVLVLALGLPALGQTFTDEVPPAAPQLAEEFELEGEEPEEDEIETDRDSFTPATTVAGYRHTIVEAAYSFIDNRTVPETHSFPELIVRIGVADWLELHIGENYEVGGAGNPISGNVPDDVDTEPGLEHEHRLGYGTKAKVSYEEGIIPSSAIIVQGYTPTSGESTDTTLITTYVFGWTVMENWTWDTAIRYGTGSSEDDRFNTWAPSSVIKIPVGERWKVHAEYFGIFTDGRGDESVQQFFSPGAHYLITPEFEVGVRVGWGLNQEAANFFSNAGLGYRF
jgi:hypothetical protein